MRTPPPTDARARGSRFGHLIYGFQLGNEQNSKYSGSKIATNFAILHNLTLELWPDQDTRPKLIG